MSVFTNDITVEPGSSPLSVTGSAISVTNFPATQPISGSVSVSNFPATQPVSVAAPIAVTQSTSPWVVSGTVTTVTGSASAATITRVATTAVSVTLLAANVNRKKALIMTETGATNYVAFGSAATATNYTYMLGSTMVLEVINWTGSITLARSTGTGNVQVTELV